MMLMSKIQYTMHKKMKTNESIAAIQKTQKTIGKQTDGRTDFVLCEIQRTHNSNNKDTVNLI